MNTFLVIVIAAGILSATATTESGVIECGPSKGMCPNDMCCSLFDECGTSEAHCNRSLGCKRKYGRCNGGFVMQSSSNSLKANLTEPIAPSN